MMLYATLHAAPLVAQQPASDSVTAFEHVTVVDVVAGVTRPNQTVVVQGSRIAAVAPASQVGLSRGVRRIDARGAFVIPGLWDMHVHADAWDALALPLLVAHGVLGVRDMGSRGNDGVRWRNAAAAGSIAPHVVTATRIVDGPRGRATPASLTARTAADGRRAVDSVKSLGADFVKVYDWLPVAAYRGVVARAKALRLPLAGHLPVFLSARAASEAGQRSFEHPEGGWAGLLVDASRDEAELRAELIARADNPDAGAHLAMRQKASWVNRLVRGFDARKLESLAALFARTGTYQTPTLAITRRLNRMPEGNFASSPMARYVPVAARAQIGNPNGPWWRQFDAEDILAWRARDRLQVEIVRALHRAGAPIMAGTDGGMESASPLGPSLHEELLELTEAGLSPLSALRAATIVPARYLGAVDRYGAVAPGRAADLVLLEGNPLTDIRNTARIRAVVANGRYLRRAQLDSMLSEVVRRANEPARSAPR